MADFGNISTISKSDVSIAVAMNFNGCQRNTVNYFSFNFLFEIKRLIENSITFLSCFLSTTKSMTLIVKIAFKNKIIKPKITTSRSFYAVLARAGYSSIFYLIRHVFFYPGGRIIRKCTIGITSA